MYGSIHNALFTNPDSAQSPEMACTSTVLLMCEALDASPPTSAAGVLAKIKTVCGDTKGTRIIEGHMNSVLNRR